MDGDKDTNADVHPVTNGHASGEEQSSSADIALGIPSSVLIVTNIPDDTFISANVKKEFEGLFQHYDPAAQFYYLRSFRRSRVVFHTQEAATKVHDTLYRYSFNGQEIRCYYAQPPIETRDPANNFLEPPLPDKQFLISPPSSPPVGWEVISEREPAINYDLINAIAQMGPGESYKLHQGSEDQPSIVVYVCDDLEGYKMRPSKIEQTRCPDRKPE